MEHILAKGNCANVGSQSPEMARKVSKWNALCQIRVPVIRKSMHVRYSIGRIELSIGQFWEH